MRCTRCYMTNDLTCCRPAFRQTRSPVPVPAEDAHALHPAHSSPSATGSADLSDNIHEDPEDVETHARPLFRWLPSDRTTSYSPRPLLLNSSHGQRLRLRRAAKSATGHTFQEAAVRSASKSSSKKASASKKRAAPEVPSLETIRIVSLNETTFL